MISANAICTHETRVVANYAVMYAINLIFNLLCNSILVKYVIIIMHAEEQVIIVSTSAKLLLGCQKSVAVASTKGNGSTL